MKVEVLSRLQLNLEMVIFRIKKNGYGYHQRHFYTCLFLIHYFFYKKNVLMKKVNKIYSYLNGKILPLSFFFFFPFFFSNKIFSSYHFNH